MLLNNFIASSNVKTFTVKCSKLLDNIRSRAVNNTFIRRSKGIAAFGIALALGTSSKITNKFPSAGNQCRQYHAACVSSFAPCNSSGNGIS